MISPFFAIVGTRAERNRFAILQLQRYLRRLNDPNLVASGVWDARTVQAVRAFQARYGMPQTGRVDLVTWEAINERGEEAILAASDPLPLFLPPFWVPSGKLSPGDRGEAVALIQIMLNRFLLTIPGTDPLSADGFFGPETAAAVVLFRRVHGAEEGESVDKEIWNLLTASFRTAASYE